MILLNTIVEDMDVPKEIVIWNYFDHEHVVGTHYKHYNTVRVIHEMDTWAMCERTRKLPIINCKVSSMDFAFLENLYHIKAYHFGHLFKMEQDIYFSDLENDSCRVKNEYRLHVPFFLWWMEPIWKRVTTSWFWVQWNEDIPMRRRRWKVLKLGFVDFYGLNRGLGDPRALKLPVTKSTLITAAGFPRLFSKSEEVGYSYGD